MKRPCTGLAKHFGGIANEAEGCGNKHKRHEDQKPGRVVDTKDIECSKDLGPEGTELIDIVNVRGGLRNNSSNGTCNTKDG